MLRRNIADLEKKHLELEKKYVFSMEMYELMMKRVTNAEISVSLLRSVEQTRGQRQTGRNDLPGRVREVA